MPVIQANGIGIYYEWHGADGAPVLVLNNGILMNAAASWVPQTAAFAASYRVLQYYCRGQGQSEHHRRAVFNAAARGRSRGASRCAPLGPRTSGGRSNG